MSFLRRHAESEIVGGQERDIQRSDLVQIKRETHSSALKMFAEKKRKVAKGNASLSIELFAR